LIDLVLFPVPFPDTPFFFQVRVKLLGAFFHILFFRLERTLNRELYLAAPRCVDFS